MHDDKERRALLEAAFAIHHQHGLKGIGRIVVLREQPLPRRRLHAAQPEPARGIVLDNKVGPGTAELADTVEQNDGGGHDLSFAIAAGNTPRA